MPDTLDQVSDTAARSPRRSADGRTPPGYRVLHVIVPESIFNNVKAQAYLSGMRFPEYVARFLEEARPYKDTRTPQVEAKALAAEVVSPRISEQGNRALIPTKTGD